MQDMAGGNHGFAAQNPRDGALVVQLGRTLQTVKEQRSNASPALAERLGCSSQNPVVSLAEAVTR